MPKWTPEQQEAIEKSGTNIIVSAGAGSGKTAVLTERVIHKLSHDIKINELLILTFTNAAAAEMKDRIRKKINDHEELKDNLDLLDSSYITTFDSFTLSLVKKYNYLLNVSSNLNIIDSGIVSLLKEDILNEVFDEIYEENNPKFNKLVNDFCTKNDKSLKASIMAINEKLNMKSNKKEYLDTYLTKYYSKENIDNLISEYVKLIKNEVSNIEENIMLAEDMGFDKFYKALVENFTSLINSASYDELKHYSGASVPRRPPNSEELIPIKNSIDASNKVINELTRFASEEEIRNIFDMTKDYTEVIIDIINRFDEKLNKYKHENDLYEFIDIELMAINLLKDNEDICDELKYTYKEIMVDEYQDTNDLQEEFINLIENDNVYMVGDIKQSIYGFRNANPSIFKAKYDKYAKGDDGYKIDLLKNFRSRSEVLNGINEIFNLIMDDTIGGADYIKDHQMVFGNTNYEVEKTKANYDLEILNYAPDNRYSKEEIETFIIGKDILEKIKNGYEVVDKDSGKLRKASFKDFCIIMDRGSSFDIYSKVFEYLGIPINIYIDQKLTTETDILLLNNLFGFALKVHEEKIDTEFKYFFTSIARSYLFEMPDKDILKIINKKSYAETSIYQKALEIDVQNLSSYEIIERLLEVYNFYESLIKKASVNESIIRIENILKTSENLCKMGYSPAEFKDYLDRIIASDNEITYKGKLDSSDSVKLMNIHKSKGLEFPVCYFSGYHKGFNKADIKERFVYHNSYGIITPYFNEGIGDTILKDLLKSKYNLDNISERIRLFYVALTRAKEKMIIVTSLDEEREYSSSVVDYLKRIKYSSFLSIINSISSNLGKYVKNINIEDLNISRDYKYPKEVSHNQKVSTTSKLVFKSINIPNEEIDEKHASKTIMELITKEGSDTLSYGTHMHEVFERCDFLNLNENDENYDKLNNFVKKFNIKENTKIYKEHEFMFDKDDVTYHGIIDLVLINDAEIKIVDYKLKNIHDEHYVDQLRVYYDYLSSMFDKKITCYLYSIILDEYKEVSFD